MSYNKNTLATYVNTAGKITVVTALLGVVVFSLIFLLNIGAKELQKVEAQTDGVATTSVTVLNTPPAFTVAAEEEIGSSVTTPTNSGSEVAWVGTAVDSNGESYFMLICSTSATPTANVATRPTCGIGATEWAVSATTTSGSEARAATTTTEAFAESNIWYAYVCDFVAVNPRCNSTPGQGSGTTSSPFSVNHRPVFTGYWDTSPANPGVVVQFNATSSDADTDGAQDTVRLIVCRANTYSTVTDTCGTDTIATTSVGATSNATATYTIVIPTQDTTFFAYGFIIDNHGHEASGGAHGTDSTLTVNNVAPAVAGATIVLNGGLDLALSVDGGETASFTLAYTVADNNSCDAVGGGLGDEISGYVLSVLRSGVGTVACDGTAGSYDPNDCYPSGVGSAAWNLSCTASSTSCTGATDIDQVWDCTFPLWYIADPTSGVASDTIYFAEDWRGAVAGVDDDFATGTYTQSTTADIDVLSFLALGLLTATIPYGSLEPGSQTDPLSAVTTIEARGNTGLDQELSGESMCGTYTTGNPCPALATSTIPDSEQVYATSAVTYVSGASLSSTTPATLAIHVPKSTSTSTPESGDTYWGIRVPIAITLAGSYTGENTFTGVVSDPTVWDGS